MTISLNNKAILPVYGSKAPLFVSIDNAISQDRIPGIATLIPNFHAHYNNLQILWAGRFPKYSPWKGLQIPIASTSDPRSIQGQSGYMEWVIEQNVKRLARLLGWDETGYASDYLRTPTLTTIPKKYDVSSFSIRDNRVVLKPLDYSFYPGGAAKTGIIAEEGLWKRKLDGLGEIAKEKTGQVVTGKDVSRKNVGFLGMVDNFFVWLNAMFGD